MSLVPCNLYQITCPSCGTELAVELEHEITEITGPCGFKFLAQHPDTLPTKPKPKKKKPLQMPQLSLELLEAADDVTSCAVIDAFAQDPMFRALSKSEMEGILARDAEDDSKLAEGIKLAIAKGAVPANVKVEPTMSIDVYGKTADRVCDEIIAALGDAPKRGCILILQGLSGTGKGTTVAKLQSLLPRASTWSNGNIFRSLTLLAVTYCESHGLPFSSDVLTPQLLRELMTCLHFERKPSAAASAAVEFDVRIEGLGIKAHVSQVQNTLLKAPKVGAAIPTVARMTQGEVISFAAAAADTMRAAGCNVLMEGRSQTLDFVRTPLRFELTLSKPLIIGQRRAAQRMVGAAVTVLRKQYPEGAKIGKGEPGVVKAALASVLEPMALK